MYRLRQFIPKSTEIEIIPIGDIHYGSPNCNLKYLCEILNYIANTDNCYIIGMGDYFDCIIPKDPRFDPTSEYSLIDESYDKVKSLFEPIKHKVLCLLIGNHEYHLVNDGYANLVMRLARELGVTYAGSSSFLRLETMGKNVKMRFFYRVKHFLFNYFFFPAFIIPPAPNLFLAASR